MCVCVREREREREKFVWLDHFVSSWCAFFFCILFYSQKMESDKQSIDAVSEWEKLLSDNCFRACGKNPAEKPKLSSFTGNLHPLT